MKDRFPLLFVSNNNFFTSSVIRFCLAQLNIPWITSILLEIVAEWKTAHPLLSVANKDFITSPIVRFFLAKLNILSYNSILLEFAAEW